MNSRKCDECGDILEKASIDPVCYACSVSGNLDELASLGEYLSEYDGLSERTL